MPTSSNGWHSALLAVAVLVVPVAAGVDLAGSAVAARG
ncbi:hypothetical protein FRUB_08431 [Fimbriiglobus ruber]|uniref:Uncharacterized protein n=1 Tax=Fimbriiglobus ruber TaxID=1908690 RepID=A0A225DBG6_9BACT|nr:hypothetical protein FRUB_08431 [Fimbriiglobus ruber]